MSDASASASAELSSAEAIAAAADGGWLLDVREQDEWDRGHAPTAHLIPMSELQSRVDEIPDDKPVMVICHSGARSARVVDYLSQEGYDVVNVAGGMMAWQSAGGVVVVDGTGSALV